MSKVRASELLALKQYVDAFKERFVCQRCGVCCTRFKGVKLTEDEIRRLGVPQAEWHSKFKVMEGQYVLTQPCFYYDAGRHACNVYDNRPVICRNFPINTVMCTDGHRHLGVSSECHAALETLAQMESEILGSASKHAIE